MTARAVAHDEPAGLECWCCGSIEDAAKLVHLGNHPEVVVCIRCVHSLSKWAREIDDQSRTGPGVRTRDRLRRVRKAVVQHGWHHSRLIGRPIRWIGKHTP